MHLCKTAILVSVLASILLCGSAVHAQPTAEERIAAADAYDHAVAAFRAGDYMEAARLFQSANTILPSSAAIVQAIRAYRNVHDNLRAGSLALRLENEPGLSARAAATVRQALASASPRYVRVDVACSTTCSLTVDGHPQQYPRFFIEPGPEVEIIATFMTGDRTERVSGRAGNVRSVAFEAPGDVVAPSDVAEAAETAEDDLAVEETENPYRISRLRFLSRPRATFFMTLTAASAVGGIAAWSAVDAGRSSDSYRHAVDTGAPADTIAVLRSQHRQDVRRTHGYIGFAALMTGFTGLVAAFTDWTPHGTTTADVEVSAAGASVEVTHRF